MADASKLKELTWEHHQNAERQAFASRLLRGLSPEDYHTYLYNQFVMYGALEALVDLEGIEHIKRAKKISADIKELEKEHDLKRTPDQLMPVVSRYISYLTTLDQDELMAHIYVRHFGDMYGGQVIKKRNPGSGTMYDFDDVEELKTETRSRLSNSMADEATECFKFATLLFEQLSANE